MSKKQLYGHVYFGTSIKLWHDLAALHKKYKVSPSRVVVELLRVVMPILKKQVPKNRIIKIPAMEIHL